MMSIDQPLVSLQKAIMECDDEWAMNKKVVDLSAKDIRQSVRPFHNCTEEFRNVSVSLYHPCSLS